MSVPTHTFYRCTCEVHVGEHWCVSECQWPAYIFDTAPLVVTR